MELEWDETKWRWTLENRNLDFADVARVDPASIVTSADTRHDYGEQRFSYLDDSLVNFVWTPRGDRIRIISMRRANDRERKKYQAP